MVLYKNQDRGTKGHQGAPRGTKGHQGQLIKGHQGQLIKGHQGQNNKLFDSECSVVSFTSVSCDSGKVTADGLDGAHWRANNNILFLPILFSLK